MAAELAKTQQACLMMCSEQDLFRPCFEEALMVRQDATALYLSDDAGSKSKAIFDFIQSPSAAD
jgi:hypothetical protein